MSIRPAVRLRRYFDNVSTMYNEKIANKSNNMLYSVEYGFSVIDCFPGVFRFKIFFISHGIPSDIKMAKELAPRLFDTPTPPSFLRTISTLDIPSGMQPPAAKNVIPITASGIENVKPAKKNLPHTRTKLC